jgi:arginase
VTRAVDVPRLAVLGVPTTAGSHHAGQEKAPAALRSAGLVTALRAAGREVDDVGDLEMRRHRPCPPVDGVRDLPRVVDMVREVADRVAEVHASGARPLVLGGDCTVTLGVVAGLARHVDVGLVYVDGDADLNTPETSSSGVLDTMGVTHLLGGGAPALAGAGPRSPLLPADHLELFGFDPGELDTGQWTRLVEHRLSATPAPLVRQDPVQRAGAALRRLESRADAVLVHLDVDVLDTNTFPLANFPHAAGLTLTELAACLRVLCHSSAFAGLVLTEVNPDHDPDGDLLRQLVEVLVAALRQSPPATRSTAPVQ